MFGVTTGQDYNIYVINASDVSAVNALAPTRTNLTKYEWKSLYDTQYVPSAGDLYLVIDEFGLGVKLDPRSSSPNRSYLLTTEFQASIDSFILGPIRPNGSEISVDVTLNAEFMTYSTKQPSSFIETDLQRWGLQCLRNARIYLAGPCFYRCVHRSYLENWNFDWLSKMTLHYFAKEPDPYPRQHSASRFLWTQHTCCTKQFYSNRPSIYSYYDNM